MTKKLIRVFQYFTIILAFFMIIVRPFSIAVVNGPSMLPNYKNNQIVIVTKMFSSVNKGDVLLIHRSGETIIKRVALVQGESYYLCKEANEWSYLNPRLLHMFQINHRLIKQIKIPENYVFVLGDNTYESQDSRTFGPICINDVSDKVLTK